MKTQRVALYMRVSSEDSQAGNRQQGGLDSQVAPLTKYCEVYGYNIVARYTEKRSGTIASRVEREKLIEQVKRGEIDKIVVWKLDRWSRNMKDIIVTMDMLKAHGCDLCSVTEQLDTSSATGELLRNILGAVASFTSHSISENIKRGLAHRKREGKRLGRKPTTSDAKRERVLELRAQGLSIRKIAAELGIGKKCVEIALALDKQVS